MMNNKGITQGNAVKKKCEADEAKLASGRRKTTKKVEKEKVLAPKQVAEWYGKKQMTTGPWWGHVGGGRLIYPKGVGWGLGGGEGRGIRSRLKRGGQRVEN